MFGNPLPYHYVGRAEKLPTLTIVHNNMMWGAVRQATLDVYPDGNAAKANSCRSPSSSRRRSFEKVIETCGGRGEKVEGPDRLLPGAGAQPRRGAVGHAGDAQRDDAGAPIATEVVAGLRCRPRAGRDDSGNLTRHLHFFRCDRARQKTATASTMASLMSAWRSGDASASSSSRLMIEPASSSTAGMRVSFSTTSSSKR